MTEIEPCPWCEDDFDDDIEAPRLYVLPWGYRVECLDCNTRGPSRRTKDEAIAAWNALLALEAEVGHLKEADAMMTRNLVGSLEEVAVLKAENKRLRRVVALVRELMSAEDGATIDRIWDRLEATLKTLEKSCD